jgi:hypothetical protein
VGILENLKEKVYKRKIEKVSHEEKTWLKKKKSNAKSITP